METASETKTLAPALLWENTSTDALSSSDFRPERVRKLPFFGIQVERFRHRFMRSDIPLGTQAFNPPILRLIYDRF